MSYDNEVRAGQNWKACGVCGTDYLDECPSCNPRTLYHVEVGIPNGEDDFEMIECECGCEDFWDKKEAIAHARSLITNADQLVRVLDDKGRTIWES